MSINNWGPAIWLLFHTIVEKIKQPDDVRMSRELFYQIKNICKHLPCPDCAIHATNFLANVNINKINSKMDLKDILYIFHNSVNTRKNKVLFSVNELDTYKNMNLSFVINNFIMNYSTHGNMKLIMDAFQRKLIITQFYNWLVKNKYYLNP
jgi:hypothetical protein